MSSPTTLIMIASLVCASLPLEFGAVQKGDQRKRVVEDHSYSDSPVQIISARTGKRALAFKQSFLDDDEWMKGLTVQIVNKSDKRITYVGIDILFERSADQAMEPPAFWNLSYGTSPFSFEPGEEIPTPTVRPIQPGEKVLISLSESEYDELRAFLSDTHYPSTIEKVKIRLSTVGFDDGTVWNGRLYRRDPAVPHGWSPKEKTLGSTRNRTAFPFLRQSYNHSPVQSRTSTLVIAQLEGQRRLNRT